MADSIKILVDSILDSLDQKPANLNPASYITLNQLSSTNVKILINSSPLADKQQFHQYWLKLPLTQHRLSSFDYHAVPGLDVTSVVVTGKVRFDESGKNKLNESADLVQPSIPMTMNTSTTTTSRPIWGSWFGFTIVLAVDSTKVVPGGQASANAVANQECINSFNYKVNYIPSDSVIQV